MDTSLKASLRRLERLSPGMLREKSQQIRARLAGAEWWMSLCLLAAVRTRSFRALGYSTISEYAEKTLHLSGQKTGRLLSAARALEHLPLLSEAFRSGKLCWAKLRAINGLVSPETEAQWLEFALAHSTQEVVRKVALSPSAWKRHQALKASLSAQPVATPSGVQSLLKASSTDTTDAVEASKASGAKPAGGDPQVDIGPSDASASPRSSQPPIDQRASLPCAPARIRVVLELTPDQFALFERAENRARAQAQKRISRTEAVTAMAQSFLEAGTARSRAKHQVVIHTDASGNTAWYETEKGPLPVDPQVLEQARQEREPLLAGATGPPLGASSKACRAGPPSKVAPPAASTVTGGQSVRRRSIPNSVLRSLHALSGQRCQRCGERRGPFDNHHTQPISDGGAHDLATLRVLCRPCHTLLHEPDYEDRPHWAAAKAAKLRKATERSTQAAVRTSVITAQPPHPPARPISPEPTKPP